MVNTFLKSVVNLKVFIQYLSKKNKVNLTNIFEFSIHYYRSNINLLVLCTESIDSELLIIVKLQKRAKNS